jgi:arginase family enzyme
MNIIKAPFSGGGLGHGNGANKAPDVVVDKLKDIFSNEDKIECEFEVEDLVLDENNIEESHNIIFNKIKSISEKAIIVGGDHSITYPAVKGFSKNVKDFKLMVFDAHPDLMDNFVPPSQEDYLRVLIEEKIVAAKDVIIIGVRNWDEKEIAYLEEKNIQHFTCKQIFEDGIKNIMSTIIAGCNKPIYLSIDIDCVDPVEAIGTGYTEHGGLSSRELIYALQQLKLTGKITMCDLVEINPDKDIKDITSMLGAKIIAELCDF